MVRRHASSPAFASAYVFPGGTVRADDQTFPISNGEALAGAVSFRSDTPVDAAAASALFVCAVRELFEEAGVLLARDATGELLRVDASQIEFQERLESTRLALQAGQLSLEEVLTEHGWQPDFDGLVPFSHWITPRAMARRWDTRFFVAELPPGQSALHDTIESTEGVWLAPSDALGPDYHTVYATAQHLQRISAFPRVSELMRFAREKTIRMVSPDVNEHAEGLRVYIRPDIAESW